MRDWTGGPWHLISEPAARDFGRKVDYFLRDLSRGIRRISDGDKPDGSGDALPGMIAIPNDPGAVLFVGAGPVLDTDGTLFFYDDANKRLGLGTNSPDARLHVQAFMPASMVQTATANPAPQDWGVVGFGGVAWQAIETNDGATSYIRQHGDVGAYNADFTVPIALSTSITSWKITYIARYNPGLSPPLASTTLNFSVVRSDGNRFLGPDVVPSNLTSGFVTYTTIIDCTGIPNTSGQTANSFRVTNTVPIFYDGYIEITQITIEPTAGTSGGKTAIFQATTNQTEHLAEFWSPSDAVLSEITVNGNYALASGAAAFRLYTSSSAGVGSWQDPSPLMSMMLMGG